MSPAPTPLGPEWKRKSYLSWLALGCSALLTVLAWSVVSRTVQDHLAEQFTVRSDQMASAIDRRVADYEAALRGVVALFLVSDDVSRADFQNYLRHLELSRYYPGIQGVGHAKLVKHHELDSFVARVRDEGAEDFLVTPAGDRDTYTPIVFLEPPTGRNERAFGFDMYSEPTRREAMDRAWQSGHPAASGITKLVQETSEDVQPGFLIYLPVFRDGQLRGRAETTKLHGFIYSPFRCRDLIFGILGTLPDDIDFTISDGEAQTPFFASRTRAESERADALTRSTSIDIGGRPWTLRFWARPNFGSLNTRREPLGVLVAGVVINLLLFYIFSSNASLQRRAHALAQQMTAELTASHAREQAQMLASLREKETLLKEIHHRVKNNLQVVSSLLSLQRNQTLDARAAEPLRQSQHRVLALATLHEFLYQSRDLSAVDTRAYLTHVVNVLLDAYQALDRVQLELALDDVTLDVDRAIPCGLITNELVSNALKYAFPGDARGHLRVSLKHAGDELELRVEDDGVGLAPSFALDESCSLGLQLVQLLAAQLHGTVHAESDHGASFSVRFPAARA